MSQKVTKLNANKKYGGVSGIALLLLVVLFGVTIYGVYLWQQRKITKLDQQVTGLASQLEDAKKNQQATDTYTSSGGVRVKLYSPHSNTRVTSPIAVVGEVPGSWSFEASFPVKLLDSKGNVIAQAPAQILGDWMTDQLVPFSVKLEYSSTPTGTGALILQKDNPSGLAKNDDTVSIPIKF